MTRLFLSRNLVRIRDKTLAIGETCEIRRRCQRDCSNVASKHTLFKTVDVV